MFKKIISVILLIIVLLIIIVVIRLITNPLLKSNQEIRENLFEVLPMGTKMDEVIKHINSKRKSEIDWIDYDSGFYYSFHHGDVIGGRDRVIGEKSIRIVLGTYYNPYPFETAVVVHFGFDENSELIEIWVRKDTDAF